MKFTFFKKAGKFSKWAVRLGRRAVHLTESLICSLWRGIKDSLRKVKDFLWWLFDFDSNDPQTIIMYMHIHKYIYVILFMALNGQFVLAGICVIIILLYMFVMRKYRQNKCLV